MKMYTAITTRLKGIRPMNTTAIITLCASVVDTVNTPEVSDNTLVSITNLSSLSLSVVLSILTVSIKLPLSDFEVV